MSVRDSCRFLCSLYYWGYPTDDDEDTDNIAYDTIEPQRNVPVRERSLDSLEGANDRHSVSESLAFLLPFVTTIRPLSCSERECDWCITVFPLHSYAQLYIRTLLAGRLTQRECIESNRIESSVVQYIDITTR
jgi:hypothetical protein